MVCYCDLSTLVVSLCTTLIFARTVDRQYNQTQYLKSVNIYLDGSREFKVQLDLSKMHELSCLIGY